MITFNVFKESGRKKIVLVFFSVESAKKKILPIVREMEKARKEERKPKEYIDGVSYDSASEREMLISIGLLHKDFKDALI